MKIAVGSDHAGFRLKGEIIAFLRAQGLEVIDMGTSGEESVDYPDFALKVAESVRNGESNLGVLVCGTGLGMAIAANKVPGVRAVTCTDPVSARLSREHNDANVLCLGARITGGLLATEIVKEWLAAEFQGGRHQTRVDKISSIEKKFREVDR